MQHVSFPFVDPAVTKRLRFPLVVEALGVPVIPETFVSSYKAAKLAEMPQSNFLGRLFDGRKMFFAQLSIISTMILFYLGLLLFATLIFIPIGILCIWLAWTIVNSEVQLPSKWVEVSWREHLGRHVVPEVIMARVARLRGLGTFHVLELRKGDVLFDPILVVRSAAGEDCVVGIWEDGRIIV